MVPPLLTVSPALNNYQITLTRPTSLLQSYLAVPTLALANLLQPLVTLLPLAQISLLLDTVTLALAVLLHGDGGALLVTEPRPQPAPGQHDGDSLGPGEAGDALGQAGGGVAASSTAVDLNVCWSHVMDLSIVRPGQPHHHGPGLAGGALGEGGGDMLAGAGEGGGVGGVEEVYD